MMIKSVLLLSEVKMSFLICCKFCFASARVTNFIITKVYSAFSFCGYSGGVILRTVVIILFGWFMVAFLIDLLL